MKIFKTLSSTLFLGFFGVFLLLLVEIPDKVYSQLKRDGVAEWQNEISHVFAKNLIKDYFTLLLQFFFKIVLELFQYSF